MRIPAKAVIFPTSAAAHNCGVAAPVLTYPQGDAVVILGFFPGGTE